MEGKMTGAGVIPSVAGGTATLPIASVPLPGEIKKTWLRRVAPCLAFLAAFSTAMALLLIWSEAAAQRRQAFDANMTRDYVFGVSMDNPQLVTYIREVHLKKPMNKELHNITETPEEKFLVNFFKGKREGVYLEYINHAGAISTSSWLEANYAWRGLLVLTDFKSFFEASKSFRNPMTRAVHACLSTDKDTKEITYHQESDVRVTKLSEGPNSLFPDEGLPTMRLKCFPLYSLLLAYNQTTIDYFSLDSIDSSDSQVLDTIPWDVIRISVLSIRTSNHQSEADVRSLIAKLSVRRYKLVNRTDTGKLIFTYSTLLKI
ncbi:protein Star-like [Diachasmimorpha longicaudata]|uniref:protein Star-like n=1 Tax=Diachasmimorpha longicaudata TaxID=58733 RepID=UPI0030B89FDB